MKNRGVINMPMAEGEITTIGTKENSQGKQFYWVKLNGEDPAYFTYDFKHVKDLQEGQKIKLEYTQKSPSDRYPKIKSVTVITEPVQKTVTESMPESVPSPRNGMEMQGIPMKKDAIMARMSALRAICDLLSSVPGNLDEKTAYLAEFIIEFENYIVNGTVEPIKQKLKEMLEKGLGGGND